MGIKGWIFTGLALAVGAAYVLGKLMKEDESAKKVERIIRDVDNKDDKKEEEGDSVEKMNAELVEAMKDLDLDKEADAFVEVTNAINAMNKAAIEEIRAATGKSPEDILKDVKLETGEFANEWIDRNFRNMAVQAINAAIANNDFTQMYNLFEQRYNKQPVQMSRATAFTEAMAEGFISEELFEKAREFFGDLWNYVGD